MRVLVTGSSGHLGEALERILRDRGTEVVGLDIRPSEWTDVVGSVADTDLAPEVVAVVPVPKNIYGVTKAAAEDLCRLTFRDHGLPGVVLRVDRFFPEADDVPDAHEGRSDDNVKADEYASRRVPLEDVVAAHFAGR